MKYKHVWRRIVRLFFSKQSKLSVNFSSATDSTFYRVTLKSVSKLINVQSRNSVKVFIVSALPLSNFLHSDWVWKDYDVSLDVHWGNHFVSHDNCCLFKGAWESDVLLPFWMVWVSTSTIRLLRLSGYCLRFDESK